MDQWTKSLIMGRFALHESLSVAGDFVRLTYVKNTGAAFSLFSEQSASWRDPLLLAISVLVMGGILFSLKKINAQGTHQKISYGLILGGAAGNFIDRVQYGAVIDFVDIGIGMNRWPVFNVADSAVCVGVILLVVLGFIVKGSELK